MFEFYSLEFGSVWILHYEVSKFKGIKFKHSQTLEGNIQILKC